jgi:hypothetical protein
MQDSAGAATALGSAGRATPAHIETGLPALLKLSNLIRLGLLNLFWIANDRRTQRFVR